MRRDWPQLNQPADFPIRELPQGVDPSSVALSEVHGGITNQLFRADFSGGGGDGGGSAPSRGSLLVRIFGGEGMIDRDVENAAFEGLSAAGVGVPYYGRFGNGRVEGWLQGAEAGV